MLCYKKLNCDLQGGVRFPTGGKVRERLRAESV